MPWEQLEATVDENRRQREWEAKQPPERCPIDGTILEKVGKVRHCPFGNYTWEG